MTQMKRMRKLLIANRGEIASRVIRSARSLDIATVAVFSDADAQAPFVAEADESVALPGSTAAETYLRPELIIDAARHTGADAVHPGYGFLSENADFAEACAAAGLTFVGPPPAAIRSMGSKTSAKQLMAEAGVPVLPGIAIGDGEQLPAGLADRAETEIGFPVLVKAAFGGGGRGMRVVATAGELTEAVAAARREAVGAFGNGTVFLERLVERPRHIEVQVFADTYGQVVHLFERECSIQRRYQKILEESPSPVVDDTLRAELGSAAIAAAKAIGYVGAGTVEFILDSSGEFFFLEVNTRLQVEHPVTEAVTGLDLVALQLAVAEGKPLPDKAVRASLSGHAIEARLYAEDVGAGYLPATGSLLLFDVPSLPGVRIDTGVQTGGQVSVHYDPMLAKVIAHAPTREQAARLLARALAETRVLGVVTNRDLLVGILREQEFLDGHIDTGYLTRHDPATLMAGDSAGSRCTRWPPRWPTRPCTAPRRPCSPVSRPAGGTCPTPGNRSATRWPSAGSWSSTASVARSSTRRSMASNSDRSCCAAVPRPRSTSRSTGCAAWLPSPAPATSGTPTPRSAPPPWSSSRGSPIRNSRPRPAPCSHRCPAPSCASRRGSARPSTPGRCWWCWRR